MKISFDQFYLFSVPVNFNIANLKISHSHHLIVVLKHQRATGVGEGVLYRTSPIKAHTLLQSNISKFFQRQYPNLHQTHNLFIKTFKQYPGIACAFDLAFYDLRGKLKNEAVSYFLGPKIRNKVPSTEQIFITHNKHKLIKKTKAIIAQGTKTIKLKAGRNFRQDIDTIKTIKKISGIKVALQLDLNKSLNFNQAFILGKNIKKDIQAWEEPIHFPNFNALAGLREYTRIPIILDESITTVKHLNIAIKAKAIDILNVKLSRLGGITGSLPFIKICQNNNIKIEIGCSEELGIGTSAQLHLASTVKNLTTLEALGSQRLGFDVIKKSLQISKGYIKFSSSHKGLGIEFDSNKIMKAATNLNFHTVGKDDNFSPLYHFWFYQHRLIDKINNGLILLNSKIKPYGP